MEEHELKTEFVYGSKSKNEKKWPEITYCRQEERTNIVIILNGDDEAECNEIKNELKQIIRIMRKKHELGYSILKLHGRKTRLIKLFKQLFDFD